MTNTNPTHALTEDHWIAKSGHCPSLVATAAINGLGFNPHQIWALARAEQPGFVQSPFVCPNGKYATMAHVTTLPPTMLGADRLVSIARAVLEQLVPEPGVLAGARRLGLFVALPSRMGDTALATVDSFRQRDRLLHDLAQATNAWCVPCEVFVSPHGHAAGAFALRDASRATASGALDAAVVLGVDGYYDPHVVQTLIDAGQVFDGDNTNAFVAGEGAAAALLVSASVAASMGMPPLAYVEATATSLEAATSTNDVPCDGVALSLAGRAALSALVRDQRVLDVWLNDLTGEEMRAHELLLALPRISGDSMQVHSRLQHIPEHCGDLGAATLPTALALACEMFAREPDVESCMATASAPNGHRGAVLLRGA